MPTAEELRRQREETSAFSRLFDYVRENETALAAEGRRPVFGGLLSKEPVMGVDTIRYEGIGPMLAGLLEPVARGVDAPRAAAQGLIPAEDMTGEAFGTAGSAMLGGGAMPKPKGALGANALRGGGMSDPTQTGWTFKDVDRSLKTSKSENRRLAGDTSRVESVPIRQLYATQPTVNPDFATTSSSFGEMPLVVRKNGKMFVQDGHHRLTKQAEGGAQTASVRFIDLDNADTSTPLLDWSPEKTGFVEADQALLDELFAANASKSAGLLGVASDVADRGDQVLNMLKSGRGSDVTDEMLDMGDSVKNTQLDQYFFENYDLPMDEASRMARGAAAGFDVSKNLYHGTEAIFDAFDDNQRQHYTTTSPYVAASYAPRAGNIIPLLAKAENGSPLVEAGGASWGDMSAQMIPEELPQLKNAYLQLDPYKKHKTYELADEARASGYSGISFKDIVDRGPHGNNKLNADETMDELRERQASMRAPSNVEVRFAPNQYRSRFARFDPRLSHLSNLNAANASPTVGLLSQAGMSEQQAERTEQILQRMGLLD